MYLARTPNTARNATNSTMKVALGTRKLEEASTMSSALGEDEHEQGGERQVDEVHAFDQTHDQEHGRVEPALHFRLPGDAGDGLASGQAVTDSGADGTAAEGEPAAREGAGQLDGLLGGCSCHMWASPV